MRAHFLLRRPPQTGWPGLLADWTELCRRGHICREVLKATFGTATTPTVLEALYHFTGSRHSFTALVHVVQSGSANGSTAVITGAVTDGWLEGNLVRGKSTVIACPQGRCYQDTLDIVQRSRSGD